MASPMTAKDDVEQGIHIEHTNQVPDGPIMLSREQYARLFIEPGGRAPAVQKFANPTPLAIISFLLCLAPTSCILLGWGSADPGTSLVSIIGAFYFIGGLGMVVSAVMEWVLGNTFPFVVFFTFGGFWLALGTLQDPMHGVVNAYSGTGGAASPAFNSGLMFYWAFWAAVCFIYLIASFRTHLVFVWILGTLVVGLSCLSAGYGRLSSGDADAARSLIKAAGGFTFATILGGFYLAFVLMFGVVGIPIRLPLGDLSGLFMKKDKRG
ncbi:hypothetical protein V5O48_001515 [Marasmius crinis-equi]|uniref:Uncharacterized protein n=1 Tax=Marasmius crinis-equi TaxID=585013 RepID=A0ABR3FZ02_9AGAR